MVEFPHALRVDGRFQLVALTYSPVYSPADVFGFAVFSSDGARLTEVVSLEQAHSRWSSLLEEQRAGGPEDETTPARTVPRRRRCPP
jgi:hypothetical protein